MHEQICPIWGTVAEVGRSTPYTVDVNSERAGGGYSFSIGFEGHLQSLPVSERARLSTWILDRNRAGETFPMVNGSALDAARSRRDLPMTAKRERMLKALGVVNSRPGRWLDAQRVGIFVLPWIEAESVDEGAFMIDQFVQDGFLAVRGLEIGLTAPGFEAIDSLKSAGAETKQAFVAMWFGPEMLPVYDEGIAPAVRDAGYEPFRIDRKEHVNKIDDEIIAEIRASRFLIADFTCPLITTADGATVGNPRGGVYYEAGFAQGLGTPVIWMAREDTIEHVHFDTRQFAHILWKEPGDLRKSLYNRIAAVIGAA